MATLLCARGRSSSRRCSHVALDAHRHLTSRIWLSQGNILTSRRRHGKSLTSLNVTRDVNITSRHVNITSRHERYVLGDQPQTGLCRRPHDEQSVGDAISSSSRVCFQVTDSGYANQGFARMRKTHVQGLCHSRSFPSLDPGRSCSQRPPPFVRRPPNHSGLLHPSWKQPRWVFVVSPVPTHAQSKHR